MTLLTRPLGTLRFRLQDTQRIGDVPSGTRVLVTFSELTWEGERFRGVQEGPLAGDWLAIGPQGTAVLDIRFLLRTPANTLVYVYGTGLTEAAKFAREGGPMFFTPRFETSDPALAWLNNVQAAGRGMQSSGFATFEMHELL